MTHNRFALFVAVAFASAALAHSVPAKAAPAQDRLRVAFAAPLDTLDPQKTSAILAGALLRSVFEQLTRVTQTGTVEPLLATGWSVGPDGKTWTFHLRGGVSFHDGTPFDANAVRDNFQRLLNPRIVIPGRPNLGTLSGVAVVDDHTVTLTTSQPFSGLPIALSHFVASMISPKSLAEWGDGLVTHMAAGTGSFRFRSIALPDEAELERDPNYWGTKPGLAQIALLSRIDPQTRLATLLSDESDIDFYVTPESRPQVEGSGDDKVINVPSIRMYVVHLPMSLPELQDLRVRQALNYSIDRAQIVRAIFQGAARPADNATGPGIVGYQPDYVYAYDPRKAADLFAQAGWAKDASGILHKDGKPFPTLPLLATRGRYPKDDQMAQVVANYFRQAGVPTDLQIQEFGVFFANAQRGAAQGTQMVQMSWGFPQMDGASFLCSVYLPGSSYNFGDYHDPEVTKDCTTIDSTFDLAKRADLIAQASKRIYDEAPLVYLVVPDYLVGENDRLQGIVLDAGENHVLSNGSWK